MTGKSFRIKRIWRILLLMAVLCQSGVLYAGTIAVVLSDDEPAYSEPAAAFMADMAVPVEIRSLRGDIHNAPVLMEDILSRSPELIFCLGAKAAYAAKVWTCDRTEIPVLFAMVLNPGICDLLEEQVNVAGVSYSMDPGTQLVNMMVLSPELETVGVIYDRDNSSEIISRARESAELLGLKLVALPIRQPMEFQHAFKRMASQINVFWVLADPVVCTLDNLSWLTEKCIKLRIPTMGQSRNSVRFGLLLSVNPDRYQIGSQAANMARKILVQHETPKDIGIVPPLGTHIVLNLKTARRIGMKISSEAVNMASEVIEK